MSKKTLNTANLRALGADRLADLLIEVSTGNAEIKRRLRLELSHNLGAAELARDVRKRLVSLRRSTSYISWRKRKTFIRDLTTQATMITDKIAPDDPAEALDLLWQFTELAPSVHERTDDTRGEIGEVFDAARARFADIAPRAAQPPEALALRTWQAVRDNHYGEFDGIIALLAPALGTGGLAHLRTLVEDHAEADTPEQTDDHAALQFLRDLRSDSGNHMAERKARLIRQCLRQIAEAEGDTDAFLAQYSEDELARPGLAADAAQRLLAEGRPGDALHYLCAAEPDGRDQADQAEWDAAYTTCLVALNRLDEAQDFRWACFCETLNPDPLRDYLKALPDFEDIEAEDRAKALVMQDPAPARALRFFLNWPDLVSAAQLIEAHHDKFDEAPPAAAAEALRLRHPRAAVLVWRLLIDDILSTGQSARYGDAADYLRDCTALDAHITDYGTAPDHATYMQELGKAFERRTKFWDIAYQDPFA